MTYTFNEALTIMTVFSKGAPNRPGNAIFSGSFKARISANLPFHITYGPTNLRPMK